MGGRGGTGARGPYGVPACRSAWDQVDHLLDDWHRERPDLDFTPVGVLTRMARVRGHLDVELARVFAGFDLTPADFLVVVTLRRAGTPYRMPQARLMQALGLTSGTVSVRLDRLERSGVVHREPDPASARGSLVTLTAKGLELFDRVAPVHLANEERLLSALTSDEQQQLADLLRRLLASFEVAAVEVDRLGAGLEPAHVARRRRTAVGLSDTTGLLVGAVAAGGPADRAGLHPGDLVLAVAGRPVVSTTELAALLEEEAAGPVEVEVLRGEERLVRQVEVGAPSEERAPLS